MPDGGTLWQIFSLKNALFKLRAFVLYKADNGITESMENCNMGESRSATTILLICRKGQSRHVYQDALQASGMVLVCVESFMAFFRQGVYCPLNGIFVDMPTYMRCSEDEKRQLTELVAFFPALRLKCHEPTGEIRTLPFGTKYPGNCAPADFAQKFCAPFHQRMIRSCERSPLNLAALMSASPLGANSASEKTVTANISCGGCFLICFEPWRIGDRGWLVLTDLNDTTAIHIEVCWLREWGESGALPGMGVRFIDLSESQRAELNRLSGRNLMLED